MTPKHSFIISSVWNDLFVHFQELYASISKYEGNDHIFLNNKFFFFTYIKF